MVVQDHTFNATHTKKVHKVKTEEREREKEKFGHQEPYFETATFSLSTLLQVQIIYELSQKCPNIAMHSQITNK